MEYISTVVVLPSKYSPWVVMHKVPSETKSALSVDHAGSIKKGTRKMRATMEKAKRTTKKPVV